MPRTVQKTIARDISWLSFNARVLQEAADPTVPLKERVKFLGIFSNNLDEFFRVRVAALRRMIKLGKRARMHLEDDAQKILDEILLIVLEQQSEFNRIWELVRAEMEREKIFLVTEKDLTREQKIYVLNLFEEEIRGNVIPLMIESIAQFPYLRDKSIYLAVVLSRKDNAYNRKYALIEIPTRANPRFIELPPKHKGEHAIILLEDAIRFCLPQLFSFFEFDHFKSHIIKVTKDAEFDIDYDEGTTYPAKILKGLKSRRKGKPVRFIYDKDIDGALLEYLIRRMGLTKKDHLIPGGRIHNFRHFMEFPSSVFQTKSLRNKPFLHPEFRKTLRITDVIIKKDILLNFPYHSFDPVIDLLREAAMDTNVTSIKITAYRLAEHSKIINALINAVRNGKDVTVILELRARFDEENNLDWKERLEDEGVKVYLGVPNMKVHAKLCLIRKRVKNKSVSYGFVSTGNLNESTSKVYGDHLIFTANRNIMADVNRIFNYLENPVTGIRHLKMCTHLIVSPIYLRRKIQSMIDQEIQAARSGKKAGITLKLNSLSDHALILKLYEAAMAGVEIKMVVRGIFCAYTENKKFTQPIYAISIVDEYLEHARLMQFYNGGNEKVFISSADLMVRNLDHRIETAMPVFDPDIREELKQILEIQLRDNVKARWLDNDLSNEYVRTKGKKNRSQIEIYDYLHQKSVSTEAVTVKS